MLFVTFFLFAILLFFICAPDVLITLPRKYSDRMRMLLHAAIYILLVAISYTAWRFTFGPTIANSTTTPVANSSPTVNSAASTNMNVILTATTTLPNSGLASSSINTDTRINPTGIRDITSSTSSPSFVKGPLSLSPGVLPGSKSLSPGIKIGSMSLSPTVKDGSSSYDNGGSSNSNSFRPTPYAVTSQTTARLKGNPYTSSQNLNSPRTPNQTPGTTATAGSRGPLAAGPLATPAGSRGPLAPPAGSRGPLTAPAGSRGPLTATAGSSGQSQANLPAQSQSQANLPTQSQSQAQVQLNASLAAQAAQSQSQQQEYSIIKGHKNNLQRAYSKIIGTLDECKIKCSNNKNCVAFHKFNKKNDPKSNCFFFDQNNFKANKLVKDDNFSFYIKPKPSK